MICETRNSMSEQTSVHGLLNYDLENIRKIKNLTSSHPDLRRGTQVRDNVFWFAIKVPPRPNLTGCMIAWTFVDLEMRGTLRNKTHKQKKRVVHHAQAWKLSQCAIRTIDNHNATGSHVSTQTAGPGLRATAHESPTIKTNALATIYDTNPIVSSRPGQRTVHVKNCYS